jgi:hypothetical protein
MRDDERAMFSKSLQERERMICFFDATPDSVTGPAVMSSDEQIALATIA